jgi:hypothetical protein
MASQWDKSADLFALMARSRNCLSSDCPPVSRARILQVQKKKTAEGSTGRADRIVRQLRAAAWFAFPWRKSGTAQVCLAAADGAARATYESTCHKLQIQPIEQPSAEDFGGEAA